MQWTGSLLYLVGSACHALPCIALVQRAAGPALTSLPFVGISVSLSRVASPDLRGFSSLSNSHSHCLRSISIGSIGVDAPANLKAFWSPLSRGMVRKVIRVLGLGELFQSFNHVMSAGLVD